jgi:hypothetical protein
MVEAERALVRKISFTDNFDRLPDQTFDILLIGFDVKIRSKILIGEYGGF